MISQIAYFGRKPGIPGAAEPPLGAVPETPGAAEPPPGAVLETPGRRKRPRGGTQNPGAAKPPTWQFYVLGKETRNLDVTLSPILYGVNSYSGCEI